MAPSCERPPGPISDTFQLCKRGAARAHGIPVRELGARVVPRAGVGNATVWTAGGHCQANRNSLFFDAKSILANTTHQRLSGHVDQWNLQKIS